MKSASRKAGMISISAVALVAFVIGAIKYPPQTQAVAAVISALVTTGLALLTLQYVRTNQSTLQALTRQTELMVPTISPTLDEQFYREITPSQNYWLPVIMIDGFFNNQSPSNAVSISLSRVSVQDFDRNVVDFEFAGAEESSRRTIMAPPGGGGHFSVRIRLRVPRSVELNTVQELRGFFELINQFEKTPHHLAFCAPRRA